MHYATRSNHKDLLLSLVAHGGSFFDRLHQNQSPFDWICDNANSPETFETAMLCLRVEPEKFLYQAHDRHVNLLLTAAYRHSAEKFHNLLKGLPDKNYTPNRALLKQIIDSDDEQALKVLHKKWNINWRALSLKTTDDTTANVATLAVFSKAVKCLSYFIQEKVCTTGIPKKDTQVEKFQESYAPAVIAAENGGLACLKILQEADAESLWRPQTKGEKFPLSAAAENQQIYHWMLEQPELFIHHIETVMDSMRSSKQLPLSAALRSKASFADKTKMAFHALEMYEKNIETLGKNFSYVAEVEATTFYEDYALWRESGNTNAWIQIGERMKTLGMNQPRASAVAVRSWAFQADYAKNILTAGLNINFDKRKNNILTIFAQNTERWIYDDDNDDNKDEQVFIENMKILKASMTYFCKRKSEQEKNYLQTISGYDVSKQSWQYDILSNAEISEMNKPSSTNSLGKKEWPAHRLLRWAKGDTTKTRKVLKRLINNSMPVDTMDDTYLSVLHIAAIKGYQETCKILLKDFHAKITPTGDGSLWHKVGNEESAKVLVDYGLSLTDRQFVHEVAANLSDEQYGLNGIKLYLNAGGDVSFRLDNGNTILIEAVIKQRWDLAELLIEARPSLATEVNKQRKQAIDYVTPKAASKVPEYWDEKNSHPDKVNALARTFCKLYAISEIDQASKVKASVRDILEKQYHTWWDNNLTLRAKATEFRLKTQATPSTSSSKVKI